MSVSVSDQYYTYPLLFHSFCFLSNSQSTTRGENRWEANVTPHSLKQIFIEQRLCNRHIEVHDFVIVEGGDRIHTIISGTLCSLYWAVSVKETFAQGKVRLSRQIHVEMYLGHYNDDCRQSKLRSHVQFNQYNLLSSNTHVWRNRDFCSPTSIHYGCLKSRWEL